METRERCNGTDEGDAGEKVMAHSAESIDDPKRRALVARLEEQREALWGRYVQCLTCIDSDPEALREAKKARRAMEELERGIVMLSGGEAAP